jgi:HD-like signal output (HDOD) protein
MKRRVLCLLKDPKAIFSEGLPIDWVLEFSRDRQSAVEKLSLAPFEAVVTDDSWWEGTKTDFLSDMALRFPKLVRIRLVDPANKMPAEKSECADQYVPKPCAARALVSAIASGKLLRTWLEEPAMKVLLPRIGKLPMASPHYGRLVLTLETEELHLGEMGRLMEEVDKIMGQDSRMTGKLLDLVNSTPLRFSQTITKPSEAVAHLGLLPTKALMLIAQILSTGSAEKNSTFSFDRWWLHSIATAKLARAITESETKEALQADWAFTAGILHDAGKLLYAVNCPREYKDLVAQAKRNLMLYVEIERVLLGTTHAELGACAAGSWALPTEILEAIAWHHTPAVSSHDTFSPLTAVHVANVFARELNSAPTSIEAIQIDQGYLERIGCEERLSRWRDRCAAASRSVAA